jgi:CubicO group peptidase (beta-lactamase class C family)
MYHAARRELPMTSRVLASIACCLLSSSTVLASGKPPLTDPAEVGFSVQRLQRLTQGLHARVDAGELSGMVTLIARHGKLVYSDAYGVQDLASRKPMTEDTIFRIHSMTKPVTAVAMMMLYEEGKWSPRDLLAKHVPEFANLKVYAGLDPSGKPILEAPAHPPTLGELLTHTAGFVYGFEGSPVDKLFEAQKPFEVDSSQEMIRRVAAVPLEYHPGTKWKYSVAVDIQGYIVEKLSGKKLPQFFRERIFDPLGMKDTEYYVPQAKMSRLATMYRMAPDGSALAPVAHDVKVARMPPFTGGGGGLYSTAHDYLRFAQMLANEGELDGVRLLAPPTLQLMHGNHLAPHLLTGGFGIGSQQLRPGFGFGYNVAVFEDPVMAGVPAGKGTYLWDGAGGNFFWVDPTHDVVFIGMIQRLNSGVLNLQEHARALTYQALVDPSK